MFRILSVTTAILLTLSSAFAFAAPAHKRIWHGYGFLPGYHQPQNPHIPIYGEKGAIRGEPDFTPSYWYGGSRYYFGEPGFVRGRYNGGSMGPCWTYTPIGMIWNCG